MTQPFLPAYAAPARSCARLPAAIGLLAVIGTLASRPAFAQGASPTGAPGFTETVTVTSSRLPGEPEPPREVPANVTVITREQIARSGVRTIQQLLAREAGVIVYDQIGNGVELTFDMRGFSGGSGTAVFLDGARLNDLRNNSVSLSAVPIDSIERIEIIRGAVATLAGGGSEAGVIQILTRAGGSGGSLSAAGGTFGTQQYRGHYGWQQGGSGAYGGATRGADVSISASRDDSDGFRENGGGALDRYEATLGYGFGDRGRVGLTITDSESSLGAPGALTQKELDQSQKQSPFNALDGSDQTHRLAALNWRAVIGGGFSLAVNGFTRRDDIEALTTGRSAPTFGGFFLDEETSASGGVLQATHLVRGRGQVNEVSFGTEYANGQVDARGYVTSPADLDGVDRGSPSSDNSAGRRAKSWFVNEKWTPLPNLVLTTGLRSDDDRIDYDETIPNAKSADDDRSFSERSKRAGATWNPTPGFGLYGAYGESFLPPSVQDLFAFPGFGSNPKLDPEDARSYETGVRGDWTLGSNTGDWNASAFRIDTEDEIVFDPTPTPTSQFGQSVNAGRTRREGLELSWTGSLAKTLSGFAHVTWTNAEFLNGPDHGRTVPLVPGERVSLGVDWDLPAGIGLSADALYVSDQVLDNDSANAEKRLDSYTVVNLRARALVLGPSLRARKGETLRGIHVFAEVWNLFDKEYSTRGISAFDFSTFTNQVFLTPAPGRRLLGGIEWTF